MKQKFLQGTSCPICGMSVGFEEKSFLSQIRHVKRDHSRWQQLKLWWQTGVPLSELLYARRYPDESYLTEGRRP